MTKMSNRSKIFVLILVISLASVFLASQLRTTAVADLAPPTITNVYHSPASPTVADNVTINCNVTDDFSGVFTVKLHYREMSNQNFTEVSMTNVAGSWYQYSLGELGSGEGYRFYIVAIDNELNEATENNGGENYYFEVAVNDVEPPVIGPLMVNPPGVTYADDEITINVTSVTDFSGINSVDLYYRVNNGSWIQKEFSFNTVYYTTIGPFNANDVIQYYITATDNSSNLNVAVLNNSGAYFTINILPDPTVNISLYTLIPVVALAAIGILYKRKK